MSEDEQRAHSRTDVLELLRQSLEERQPRILVVGDLMLDRYLWGRCDRVSPEAPVPIIAVDDETLALGGAGNVAANIVALGGLATVAGVVGGGDHRATLFGLLDELGIARHEVIDDHTRRVTLKTRVVAANQQVVRYDVETTPALSPDKERTLLELAASRLGDYDGIVLSDYGKGVLTDPVCAAFISAARKLGKPIACDPKGHDFRRYADATVVTPNRAEAGLALGAPLPTDDELEDAGHALRVRHRLEFLAITLGEQGMALYSEDEFERVPTVAREVFDVTGAGDTVIAGIALALACGLEFSAACRLANRAAAVAVGKFGAATVTLDEIRTVGTMGSEREGAVMDRDQALAYCVAQRRRGRRLVFTNGCFDLIHAGHIDVIETAARLGDVVVVGINSDASIARLKPGRPVNTAADRARVLAALRGVDVVTIFAEDTPRALIEKLQPDVLLKGGDYDANDIVGAAVVRERGGSVHVVPYREGRSTTALVERIRKLSREPQP